MNDDELKNFSYLMQTIVKIYFILVALGSQKNYNIEEFLESSSNTKVSSKGILFKSHQKNKLYTKL